MKIFRATTVEGMQWLIPASGGAGDVVREACGVRQGSAWVPPELELLTDAHDSSVRIEADCPWVGTHVLAATHHARAVLEPVLAGHGQFLPLTGGMSLFNCLRVIDALDTDRSRIAYGRRTGRMLDIEHHKFRDRLIPRECAFRLAGVPAPGDVFYTEALVERLLALTLACLTFAPVGHAVPA